MCHHHRRRAVPRARGRGRESCGCGGRRRNCRGQHRLHHRGGRASSGARMTSIRRQCHHETIIGQLHARGQARAGGGVPEIVTDVREARPLRDEPLDDPSASSTAKCVGCGRSRSASRTRTRTPPSAVRIDSLVGNRLQSVRYANGPTRNPSTGAGCARGAWHDPTPPIERAAIENRRSWARCQAASACEDVFEHPPEIRDGPRCRSSRSPTSASG